MLGLSRHFFQTRNILEVDCNALVAFAPIDTNINVIECCVDNSRLAYLHTSPEYAMKRLLCNGSGDIFYLGHVFRKGDFGEKHSPEFTMAEWYRLGVSFELMIEETLDFLKLFISEKRVELISYAEAFQRYAGINLSEDDLTNFVPTDCKKFSHTEKMHFLLATKIEPNLGSDGFTVLYDFPESEASLSVIEETCNGKVAKRFEIYYKSIELANGYKELSNSSELMDRFTQENIRRISRGEKPYSFDPLFFAALKKGLPACCGVSVGFDRALMLHSKENKLQNVQANPWFPGD